MANAAENLFSEQTSLRRLLQEPLEFVPATVSNITTAPLYPALNKSRLPNKGNRNASSVQIAFPQPELNGDKVERNDSVDCETDINTKILKSNGNLNKRTDNYVSLQTKWKNVYHTNAGLYNLGNTCFLNSVLQCLVHIPPLAQYFLTQDHRANCKVNDCINCTLENLIYRLFLSKNKKPQSASQIIQKLRRSVPHFRSGKQEDAHETLCFILDEMKKYFVLSDKSSHPSIEQNKDATLIDRIFSGKLKQTILCKKCHNISSTYQSFMDLSLDVFEPGISSVKSALSKFVETEILKSSDKYFCDKCRTLVEAEKKIKIDSSPPMLVLHLKRYSFAQSYTSSSSSKVSKNITFEHNLDISKYLVDPQNSKHRHYELVGIIVHYGSNLRSGHYTAYCKGSNSIWIEFDDDHASPIGESRVLQKQAYILFYGCKDSTTDLVTNSSAKSDLANANNISSNSNIENTERLMKRKMMRHDDLLSGHGKTGQYTTSKKRSKNRR